MSIQEQQAAQKPAKIRVIVKPLEPLKPPSKVTEKKIQEFVKAAKHKFKAVLYMGWVRRSHLVYDGQGSIVESPRKAMRYFAATAETAQQARKLHKTSFKMGEEVWDLT
jgi:hypothetical protein